MLPFLLISLGLLKPQFQCYSNLRMSWAYTIVECYTFSMGAEEMTQWVKYRHEDLSSDCQFLSKAKCQQQAFVITGLEGWTQAEPQGFLAR